MSKYTTELRYICEVNAGLTESTGGNDVEQVIAKSRAKIFDFNYPIYDESYRSILETKILKHFYTREIGLETVGLWKLKLNTKMNEIMPYYNQLYKSALLEFNPLWTDDYQALHNRKIDGINENNQFSTSSENSSEHNLGTITNDETAINSTKDNEILNQSKNTDNISSGETRADNTSRDKYADTPQGALTDLEADKYLTNARKITEDNTSKEDRVDLNEEKLQGNNEKTSDSSNIKSSNNNIDTTKSNDGSSDNSSMGVNTFNNVEDYLEYVQGRRGKDASELILKYRKTFLNIDMQVIDDLEELFLHLW